MNMELSTQTEPIDLDPLPLESTAQRRQSRYYAVAVGHTTGVFTSYNAAAPHIAGHPYGRLKKFKTNEDAQAYVEKYRKRRNEPKASEQVRPEATYVRLPGYEEYRQQHAADQIKEPWEYEGEGEPQTVRLNKAFLSRTAESTPEPQLPAQLTAQANAPVDTGPPLVPEQQHVVDLILSGRNVFYTGSAGCGKSTVLKAFVRQLQALGKRVKIVAPTNLAALNVGGITTWSYAGWTVHSMKKDIDKLMQAALGDKSWDRFDETDVLVIDEISMIENLFFERLNMVIKAARGEKYGGGPFGGMQVIVTGDVSPTSQPQLADD